MIADQSVCKGWRSWATQRLPCRSDLPGDEFVVTVLVGGQRMARKEWPDDWKVGNGSARVGLGCVLAIVAPILVASILGWIG